MKVIYYFRGRLRDSLFVREVVGWGLDIEGGGLIGKKYQIMGIFKE